MTQAAKAQEPSMEEILASIRRIIADDDAATPQPRPTPPPPRASPPPPPSQSPPQPIQTDETREVDIEAMVARRDAPPPEREPPTQHDGLELRETMTDAAPTRPVLRTIEPQQDVVFDEFSPPPPPSMRAAEPPLLSKATTAAVHSAFGALAQTTLVQNAKTLEDLVREMLRPMLQAWLDDNLPILVERLVRAEIERVARGQNHR